ncbi:hypothetical protein W97_07331 [Coniosporium apollinis CBS 100218]|uniref:Uncharacterized protein n=1 Tax=Coniosporium apollinis (strain CBS 100218) TaxID=1168221 RepID=R7Z203_CONA1|nr:uncharacterized protein W97_07331 [Coniosporium apollinis CBS 100218]EON68182.1 hypothetical protein W97_07331 [Coniosporium apollinis CBS 100218]
MLDENLPTFFLKPSPDSIAHHRAYYFSQHGSEPELAYSLKHLDPASPTSKNIYAAALFDSHSPDVLFAEVLVKPAWTQPTLSQEEIRKNGGVPPPPQPILPSDFTIQLYNPEQQVVVTQKTGTWSGSSSYEFRLPQHTFRLPQHTFRLPSGSALDRSLHDPSADASTPKLNFVWKRESKLSKDFTCFLTGKSTDPQGRKKSKEPDIAIALFSSLREVTIIESNLYRVDVEDPKGLEVVLLLGAAVIKDMYFGQMKDTFNIGETARKNSGGLLGRKNSAPLDTAVSHPHAPARLSPPVQKGIGPGQLRWEIEAETARLRQQQEAEERDRRRGEEIQRRERLRAEEAEAKRIRKMVEAEDKERRRRQAEVDKETERLRKKYGTQENLALTRVPVPQRHSAPLLRQPYSRPAGPSQPQNWVPRPVQAVVQPRPPQQMRPVNGPYLQPAGHRPSASTSTFFNGGGSLQPGEEQKMKSRKKSFWGLRSNSEGANSNKLAKKKSSMF